MPRSTFIDDTSLDQLRKFFPDGVADELNFCLFSTSGVHSSYTTIEDAELALTKNELREVGYLIIQPRVVSFIYGNCIPYGTEDIKFLKLLRETSHKAIITIGY